MLKYLQKTVGFIGRQWYLGTTVNVKNLSFFDGYKGIRLHREMKYGKNVISIDSLKPILVDKYIMS
jgi:hypothetical protein